LETLTEALTALGLAVWIPEVWIPEQIPMNDGGLAVGQALVAAAREE
jgi:hydrogenase maturation factor HypF (carbamoyltransferase family)